MNTAVRVSSGWLMPWSEMRSIRINWQSAWLGLLMVLVVLSAFSIVYLKDVNRRLLIDYQHQSQQQQRYQTTRNQLLLEESTWARQSRVQHIAENELGMVMPTSHDVVLLETKDLPQVSHIDVFSSRASCGDDLNHGAVCLQDHAVIDS